MFNVHLVVVNELLFNPGLIIVTVLLKPLDYQILIKLLPNRLNEKYLVNILILKLCFYLFYLLN